MYKRSESEHIAFAWVLISKAKISFEHFIQSIGKAYRKASQLLIGGSVEELFDKLLVPFLHTHILLLTRFGGHEWLCECDIEQFLQLMAFLLWWQGQ